MSKQFVPVEWCRNTTIYEVNLRQYTEEGNFAAFREHLPRLRDMGIETLWFMPITHISEKGRKGSLGSYYACSSYRRINPEFGTFTEFKDLVAEAHQLGFKVILDWVANHTGCDHEWTLQHPDFYTRNEAGEFYDKHGWEDVIDLDYEHRGLRKEMIDAMQFWVEECDIDGFRCDMAMLTPADFWYEARTCLESIKHLFWLAELDPLDNSAYMEVFDAAYTWRWMNATRIFKSDGAFNIYPLREQLQSYKDGLPAGAMGAWFTSNHDENSWNGTEYEKYAEMALPLAVFSATWNGVPLLYSGQEIPNHKRLAFFDKDHVEWSHGTALHGFYSVLFQLRASHPGFSTSWETNSCTIIPNSVEHHVLSFARIHGGEAAFIAINFSYHLLPEVEIELGECSTGVKELFSGKKIESVSRFIYSSMEPWSYRIWIKQ
ncbi:MAG: 1,4-alpha-glucan branching protein [Bacteroidetes bacterium]|nr:1,4-alpha-glucan branching protein [Bacteroidota bacterium]